VHAGCDPHDCAGLGLACGPGDDGCGADIDCGACGAGDLCYPAGQCGCTGADAHEPDGTPAAAWYAGQIDDKDSTSQREWPLSLAPGDADWVRVDALDAAMAFIDPFVRVTPGLPVPFRLEVAYACNDGATAVLTTHPEATCTAQAGIDLGDADGAAGVHPGYACESTGGPLLVSFGPKCGLTADDSGRVYIGVTSLAAAGTGACSAYAIGFRL